jgi:hypothetical protein
MNGTLLPLPLNPSGQDASANLRYDFTVFSS